MSQVCLKRVNATVPESSSLGVNTHLLPAEPTSATLVFYQLLCRMLSSCLFQTVDKGCTELALMTLKCLNLAPGGSELAKCLEFTFSNS